jgi:hypothetical protein
MVMSSNHRNNDYRWLEDTAGHQYSVAGVGTTSAADAATAAHTTVAAKRRQQNQPTISPSAASTLLFMAAKQVHKPGSRVKVFKYKNGIRMTYGSIFQEILTASRDLTSFYIEHGYQRGPNSLTATMSSYRPSQSGTGTQVESLIPLIEQQATAARAKGRSHYSIQLDVSALEVFKTSQIFKRLRTVKRGTL